MEKPPSPPKKGLPSIEELQKKRQELEQRISSAKKERAEAISRQVDERESLIVERARLLPQLREAEETLKFFEAQNQGGQLDEVGVEELRNLSALVMDLRETVDELGNRYDELMATPEVYGRVYDDAEKEKDSMDAKAEWEKAENELESEVDSLIANAERGAERIQEAGKNSTEAIRRSEEAKRTAAEVSSSATSPYQEYVEGVQKIRDQVGFFEFKKKAELDSILRQKEVFLEADRLGKEADESRKHWLSVHRDVGLELKGERKKIYEHERDLMENIKSKYPSVTSVQLGELLNSGQIDERLRKVSVPYERNALNWIEQAR